MQGSSAQIDAKVRDLVRQGLSVFEVLTGKLRDVKPDLIVTQAQCAVCAVSHAQLQAALCEWTGSEPEILSLEPNALRDVFADIQNVANALQLEQAGQRLRAQMRGHMRAIVARVRDGQSKRLGTMNDRFGPTISDPPLGSALFFMPIDIDQFEAGDTLTITFVFNTDGHQLRRGDELSVSLTWAFSSGLLAGQAAARPDGEPLRVMFAADAG